MPNPLGNLLIILGTGHFSSFRARKVKLTKLLTQPYISVPRQVTFFFFFHQLKCQYCFPCQTLWKIIYSYWEEAIFQVSEPESKNQMSHEKKLHFVYNWYTVSIIGNYCLVLGRKLEQPYSNWSNLAPIGVIWYIQTYWDIIE